jgi:DNA polymerase-3 subunit alpha
VAEGALMIDDFSNSLRLTAEKLYSIEEARAAFARGLHLTWTAANDDNTLVRQLNPVLTPFKGGGCPVLIHYKSGEAQAMVRLGDEWRVRATDELILRLKRMLGHTAVDVKYR